MNPVVVIEGADEKTVAEVEVELQAKAPLARSEADRAVTLLLHWGWLVLFGFMRRSLLSFLFRQLWYRRRMTGLFQVTVLPGLDFVAAQVFDTAGAWRSAESRNVRRL